MTTTSQGFATCALCPRLCRHACPVVTGSGREASVPAVIAAVLFEWERGTLPEAVARDAVTLCADCGACQDACHLHVPLPERMRAARARLLTAEFPPLQPIEGAGDWVAVEVDDRPLAAALAAELRVPVRRWPAPERLGLVAIEASAFAGRAAALRKAVGSLQVVVADGGIAQVLGAADIGYSWLHELVPSLAEGTGSCRTGGDRPLACCGGAGPIAHHHPDDAARVGRAWVARSGGGALLDSRCRNHLRAIASSEASDPVDALLARHGRLAEG